MSQFCTQRRYVRCVTPRISKGKRRNRLNNIGIFTTPVGCKSACRRVNTNHRPDYESVAISDNTPVSVSVAKVPYDLGVNLRKRRVGFHTTCCRPAS